jgi:hypothetical protein
MPATSLASYLRSRPTDSLGALGLVSGILSAMAWVRSYSLEPLQPLANLFLLDAGALPIGFAYGILLGTGIALLTRRAWALPVVVVTTMYAWSAAIHTAVRLQRTADDDLHLIAASLAAGFVGAGLTHLGCSLPAPGLRRPAWRIVVTAAVGAAVGMLFYLGQRKLVEEWMLFFVWQPAVAFAIGLGLPTPDAADRARTA